jgi:hypothetical protein
MRRTPAVVTGLFALGIALNFGSTSGCGGSGGNSKFGADGGLIGGSSSGTGGSSGSLFGGGGDDSGQSSGGTAGAVCPSGAQCDVSCPNGTTTSISGKVYDPALKDGLYNITVYVPGGALQPLPKGVPTGADACDCAALFKSGAVVATTTGVDGSFKLSNAPVGTSIPVVMQVGKWRREITVDTSKAQCGDTAQPDKSMYLQGTMTGAGPNDNMPDIAVSTGSADTLECLMRRIGLPASEYTAGSGGSGHVHVFSGGKAGSAGIVGSPEKPAMPNAPASNTTLWDTSDHLMPYDILLLSCEGAETYDANPAALETYLNAGGRAFASHYHYAWFSGPIDSKAANTYTAPADWGNALATWTAGAGGNQNNQVDGEIIQTLNGSTKPFPKGVALDQWLGINGALGVQGAKAGDLPIFQPRFDAQVGPSNKPSQAWINNQGTADTMYFSFDTPVNASVDPSTGQPKYCGRAVFSDLHVDGNPNTNDNPPPPGGCDSGDLSPQEKALEFMLFDLSACVIPDNVAPPSGGGIAQ